MEIMLNIRELQLVMDKSHKNSVACNNFHKCLVK